MQKYTLKIFTARYWNYCVVLLLRFLNSLQKKINAKFTIDDQLVLRDIYNLNLDKYKEDVEEITD